MNPRSIQSDGTVNPEDKASMIFKSKGQLCPHLDCIEDKAVCRIHELPCYEGTPCQQFEQFGAADDRCMMSGFFQSTQLSLGFREHSENLKKDTKAN